MANPEAPYEIVDIAIPTILYQAIKQFNKEITLSLKNEVYILYLYSPKTSLIETCYISSTLGEMHGRMEQLDLYGYTNVVMFAQPMPEGDTRFRMRPIEILNYGFAAILKL